VDEKPSPPDVIRMALTAVQVTCREFERPDLEKKLTVAQSRADREVVVVCVAGGYKSGKSALANALIGEDVCPVDDDLATSALTAIGYSAQPFVRTYRSVGGTQTTEDIPLDQLAAWAQESDITSQHARVELVEVGLPNPILKRGLSVIDTPAIGGLRGEYATALRALLPAVDAVIFVADASAELDVAALDFLRQAHAARPALVFVLSKIDMYPHWRRIADLDNQQLTERGLAALAHPVSAELQRLAVQRDDVVLKRESGFESLLEEITREIIQPAHTRAVHRGLEEAADVLDQLSQEAISELRALEDATSRVAMLERLTNAEQRLRSLRATSARWMALLTDGFADLRTEVDRMLRALVHATVEESDHTVEAVDAQIPWEDLAARIRMQVAEGIVNIFTTIDGRADEIAQALLKLVSEEEQHIALGDSAPDLDLESLAPRSLSDHSPRTTGKIDWGIGTLRGAMGGGYLMAWLGSIAGLTLSAPIALAAGTAFAAKFVYEERSRQKERNRELTRVAVRQYVNAVHAEALARANHTLTILQRAIRDHIQERLERELEGGSDSVRSIRQALEGGENARARRIEVLRPRIQRLEAMRGELARLRSTIT
jgi:GTPase SAR1 family protein